jgi:CRP/FNR family transcriptional regulator, dissimilatory nitrate respiration regulator
MNNKELSQCPICNGLDIKDEESFLDDIKCSTKLYPPNQQIINQGDVCDYLCVLLSGSVKTEMITDNGNLLQIEVIKAPRPLAPAFLFSDNNTFPVNVTTLQETEVMKIPKAEIMRLMMTNPRFMQNYLTHNANRTQFLTNRLQLLSIKTIKGKLANYFLEKSGFSTKPFKMDRNQTELAEFFGVARPSLARSLSEMVQEGIISIQKKEYQIIDLNQMKNLLM